MTTKTNIRVVELAPKPTAELTPDLVPAYLRPIDRDSIDSRMKAQLDWEREGDVTDQTQDGEVAGAQAAATRPSKRAGKWKKRAAVGAIGLTGAAVLVAGVERALDQDSHSRSENNPNLIKPTGEG